MSEHLVAKRVYLLIFVTLMALTATTVWASTIELGRLNVVIAISIAAVKAVLVILYFMHLRWSPRLTQACLVVGFLWLALLIGLTMSDFLTRDWMRLG